MCPHRSTLHRLIASLTATMLLAAGVLSAIVSDTHSEWTFSLVAATVVAALSASASTVVFAFGLREPRILPGAMMAAIFIRSTISLGGGVAAILLLHLPPAPTLLMVLAYHLAAVVAECAVLVRAFETAREL